MNLISTALDMAEMPYLRPFTDNHMIIYVTAFMNEIVGHYLNLSGNFYLFSFRILAGFPATTTLSGKDFVTTALIPTITFSPITIPFLIVAFVVRKVFSFICVLPPT